MKTTSYRESDETTRQLEVLTERLGESRGRVIARAVDRMYRELALPQNCAHGHADDDAGDKDEPVPVHGVLQSGLDPQL